MPRCGCADACSCLIVAGDGISVEGIGTLERPYEITSESADLTGRVEFTDEGNVDFTATGVGTLNDPLTVFADAVLSTQDLTDVPDTIPADGQVLVWRIDHWEYEAQSGGSGMPPGGTDGQVLTKQSSADGDAAWETFIGGGGGGAVVEPTYASKRSHATATSIPNGSWTPVPLDTAVYEDGIPWDGISRFDIPVAGYYDIDASASFLGNATGYRNVAIYHNSTPIASAPLAAQGTTAVTMPLAATIKAVAGDYVTLRVWQNSGASLNLNGGTTSATFLSVTKTPTLSPGGGGVIVERPTVASRRHAGATGILTATVTAIPWDTLVYEEGGLAWSAPDSAWIAPSDGYYDVEAVVTFAANVTGGRFMYVYVDALSQGCFATNTNGGSVCQGAITVKALAGQKIYVKVQQTSGVTLGLNGNVGYNQVSVTKVPQSFSGSAVSTYGERIYATLRRMTAAVSCANGTQTAVIWDTVESDGGIPFDSGTAKFTVPVAGYYTVACAFNFAANGSGYRQIRLLINGGTQNTVSTPATQAVYGTPTLLTKTYLLAAGDTIQTNLQQTSGGTLATAGAAADNWISITKVPAPVINGAAASGVWGASPLNIYATDSKIGREVYIDENGQLRSKPDVIPPNTGQFPVAAPPSAYPPGTTVMSVSSADGVEWPFGGSCIVVTHKRMDTPAAAQWCYPNSSSSLKAWYRNGNTTTWTPWAQVVGESVPFATAAGSSVMGAVPANGGVSLAITYPTGRFSTIPVCVASGDSNGYGYGMAAGSSQTGVTLRYYNTTASVPSNVKVHWQAMQMNPTSGPGLVELSGNESTVTCHTDGCENAEAAILLDVSDADSVACGVCGEPITDIVDPT